METTLPSQAHASEDRRGRKRGAGRGRRRGRSAPTRRDLWGHKGHRLKAVRPGRPMEPGNSGHQRKEFWALQETLLGTGSAKRAGSGKKSGRRPADRQASGGGGQERAGQAGQAH
eukprot:16432232-Heterocapsa_arctica.AAC.1